jgi:ribosomal protein S18 acetylase RimI-like enzyme
MDPSFRAARTDDVPVLLGLMRQFYEDTQTVLDPQGAAQALRTLLEDPSLGRALMIEVGKQTAGYAVLTLGFSLEFHGRDAFVDELFVAPAFRKRGLGLAAIRELESVAAELGVLALHLEVGPENERALNLYRRAGFEDRRHHLMTRLLARSSVPRRRDQKFGSR